MAVPGHDERDAEFARKYGLPLLNVIKPINGEPLPEHELPYCEHGILFNSGEFNGLDF